MTKNLFVNLIDKLFISICAFLLIFAWINFYTRNLIVSFVLGLIFSSSCLFLFFYFVSKRNKKLAKTNQDIEQVNKCFLNFKIMTTDEQLSFLKNTLKQYNPKVENEILFYNSNKSKAVYIATDLKILTENDFLYIVKKTKNLLVEELEILCCETEAFNTEILTNIKYSIINKTKLYKKFFEPSNCYPSNENIKQAKKKPSLDLILKRFFLPHKAKSYFICGLILIFSGIILPFHVYYTVFGSMLLLFALICKIKSLIENWFLPTLQLNNLFPLLC